MRIEATALPGCKVVRLPRHGDERGSLVKSFHAETFAAHGMATDYREEFFSVSSRDVLRGLHFQVPPAEHAKLVTCLSGRVFDAVVDLRRGSPAFGRHFAVELDGDTPSSVYVPAGCAHGFVALRDDSMISYLTTFEHAPDHEAGIRWDSAGIDWPCADPVLSARDRELPPLEAFATPFEFGG